MIPSIHWFENYFITAVRERQIKSCQQKKLLPVDNAASHTACEILNEKDKFIEIKYYKYNTTYTSENDWISKKRSYKTGLLRKLQT